MANLMTAREIKQKLIDNDYYVGLQKVGENQFDLTFPLRKFKPSFKKQKLCVDLEENLVKIWENRTSEAPRNELPIPNYAHRTYVKALLYFGANRIKYSQYMVICTDEQSEMVDGVSSLIKDSDNNTDLKKEIALLEVVNPFLDDKITLEEANIAAEKYGVLGEFHTILEGESVL